MVLGPVRGLNGLVRHADDRIVDLMGLVHHGHGTCVWAEEIVRHGHMTFSWAFWPRPPRRRPVRGLGGS